MTLQVRVAWANGGSALLPEAHAEVSLQAGGAALPVVSKAIGSRDFEIPTGTTDVVLEARFSVAFGAVGAEPPMQRMVWHARQPYKVDASGTAIEPVKLPAYGNAAHPLVETHAAAAVNGAALIRLRTEFVNITPFWMAYAEDAGEYVTEHHLKAGFVALGYTGGEPKIWFASFTERSLEPAKLDISCLVFFRPMAYTIKRVDQKHHMFGLNRFLLEPVAGTVVDEWKRDQFVHPVKTSGLPDPYIWVRSGFEDALDRCGKTVVMLHPWPSGLAYGDASGGKLAGLAEAALRFLWAEQRIAKDRGPVRLGRLGLSAFSAGGRAMWTALTANADRVDEVYSFDAVGVADAAADVIRWFTGKPTSRCLRMSGGYQIAAHGAIKRGIEKLVGKTARVTADPPSAKAFAAGANPLWDDVLTNVGSVVPLVRPDPRAWHQFTVFGGFVTVPGPAALRFVRRFLQESDF